MTKFSSLARARVIGPEGGAWDGGASGGAGEGAAGVDVLVVSSSDFVATGWIGCVRCEKFQRDFVARTFALVRPVLHRVS